MIKSIFLIWSIVLFSMPAQAQDENQDENSIPIIELTESDIIQFCKYMGQYNVAAGWIANPAFKDACDKQKAALFNSLKKTTGVNEDQTELKPAPQSPLFSNLGHMYPTVKDIEIPFLHYTNKISKNKQMVTIELGAGGSYVSSKVPLAYENGGIHYVNDLNPAVFDHPFYTDYIESRLKPFGLEQHVQPIVGNCLSVFRSNAYKNLMGTVDVIYAQTLENYMTPREHKQFIELIANLLAPGGRAYLCARAYPFKEIPEDIKNNPKKRQDFLDQDLFWKYYEESMGEPYPGYASQECDFLSHKLIDVFKPMNISTPIRIDEMRLQNGQTHRIVTMNYFFKSTYETQFGAHPNLTVKKAFYCDYAYQSKRKTYGGHNPRFVAAIIEKKSI